MDLSCDVLSVRRQGLDISLAVNRTGHYILIVATVVGGAIGIGRVSQIFGFLPGMALCGEKSKLIEWRFAFAFYRMWDGMESRHPGGCKGWLPTGSQRNYNDPVCELGTCVGTATQESFS